MSRSIADDPGIWGQPSDAPDPQPQSAAAPNSGPWVGQPVSQAPIGATGGFPGYPPGYPQPATASPQSLWIDDFALAHIRAGLITDAVEIYKIHSNQPIISIVADLEAIVLAPRKP